LVFTILNLTNQKKELIVDGTVLIRHYYKSTRSNPNVRMKFILLDSKKFYDLTLLPF